MGTARKYTVIDRATGKIDRSIFSEQAVYDDEIEKIFGRAWLMIGHDSLVPAANDFFHTYMGEDPIILTRDREGRLHALLNMCRHRGNRVCRVDDGNAKRFMCTYHGWTYRNDGALEHVPGESEAYYDALDRHVEREPPAVPRVPRGDDARGDQVCKLDRRQASNGAGTMFEQDDVDDGRQVTAASTSNVGRRHP